MNRTERNVAHDIRACLLAVYDSLFNRYGPQHWWPAETPFEVAIGAILTQSTSWLNVEKAIANLKEAGALGVSELLALRTEEVATLIRPSGYYNQKAKKLHAFVRHLAERHGGEIESLLAVAWREQRAELLSIHGIGPETADSIILYAAGQPVFVVDAYTARLFGRLGFTEAGRGYAALQRLFVENLRPDVALFNEYHALIVRHGKHVCQKRAQCQQCLLAAGCPFPTSR